MDTILKRLRSSHTFHDLPLEVQVRRIHRLMKIFITFFHPQALQLLPELDESEEEFEEKMASVRKIDANFKADHPKSVLSDVG